jgi:peptidoglycan hydrolase-like protein with peptidoglycan-binding domain
MDVTQSTLMFLNGGMGDGTYGLTHYNWKAMTPGQACQTVQRSAFPDAYQAHYDDAFAFVRAYGPPASPWVLTGNQYFGPLTGPADSISGMWYTDTDVQRAAIRKIQALIGVPQNGHFDALTIATVKKWELNHNLPADGIVTKSTWGALGI